MHSILAVALLLFNTSYGAMTSRHIKALSHEDIQGLREGRGMGFALAAELNSYPGPKHVLEMADVLKLTVDQRTKVQQSHDEMKSSAPGFHARASPVVASSAAMYCRASPPMCVNWPAT